MKFVKLLIMFIASALYAYPVVNPVRAYCVVKIYETGVGDPMKTPDGRRYVLRFFLYIENQGDEDVRISTSGFRSLVEQNNGLVSTIYWEFGKAPGGGRVILSDSDMRIVCARKGEIALLQWSETIFSLHSADNIQVKVRMDEEVRQRFGLSSSISAIDIQDVEIVRDKPKR